MHQKLSQPNQNLSLLAEEYIHLISLPVLSESEADRMTEILEIANSNESLNCLIEEIEMNDYLESQQTNEDLHSSLNENQGLRFLLRLISEDTNNVVASLFLVVMVITSLMFSDISMFSEISSSMRESDHLLIKFISAHLPNNPGGFFSSNIQSYLSSNQALVLS